MSCVGMLMPTASTARRTAASRLNVPASLMLSQE
jgi:hypothetical protein